jgi:hypothetical protein
MLNSSWRRLGAVLLSLAMLGAIQIGAAGTAGAEVGAGGFVGMSPTRVLDTREAGQGPCLPAGSPRSLTVAGVNGVPANASAVSLNVTATEPTANGFLTVYPTGVTRPLASNLNFLAGQTVPNAVTVAVGTNGQIDLFNSLGCTQVVVDIVGFYAGGTPTAAGGFVGITPTRFLDTREAGQGPCIGAGATRALTVAGVSGVPANAAAVALNVTATDPTANGYVTVYPAGVMRPLASNLNFVAGQTVPNAVTVEVGTNGQVNLFNSLGCTQAVVDVVGYFAGGTPVAEGGFVGITPTRFLDTREAGQGPCVDAGATRALTVAGVSGVPSDASAVTLNVTATDPTANGYLTVYPAGVMRPLASNVNFVAGQTVPNAVTVAVGTNGQINLFNSLGCTQVVVDVVGYYTNVQPPPPMS